MKKEVRQVRKEYDSELDIAKASLSASSYEIRLLHKRIKQIEDDNDRLIEEAAALKQKLQEEEELHGSEKYGVEKTQSAERLASNFISNLRNELSLTKANLDAAHAEIGLYSKKLNDLSGVNNKLREHILLRDSLERAMSEEFKVQIAKKDSLTSSELKKIRDELVVKLEAYRNEASELRTRLSDKEQELQKATTFYRNKEQTYDEIHFSLSEQVREKEYEVERLKSFIAEKESLSQRLEDGIARELAAKNAELLSLRNEKSMGKSAELEREIEGLRQILKVKEAAGRKLFLELTTARESADIALKKLDSEKIGFEKTRQKYEKILSELKNESERAIKAIISEYSNKEASLRTENEKLAALIALKGSQLETEKKRIDYALIEFAAKSSQIIKIRDIALPSIEEETRHTQKEVDEYRERLKSIREGLYKRDREVTKREIGIREKESTLSSKEREIKSLLSTFDERLKTLESRESSIEKREQILSRQQEAFNKELGALEQAGYALKVMESRLESEVKTPSQNPTQTAIEISNPTQTLVKETMQIPKKIEESLVQMKVAVEPPAPVKNQIQLLKGSLNKKNQKETTGKRITQSKPKSPFQSQEIGYSQEEEVMSVIEVAVSHNDSVSQIRDSLLASGYSKEIIESAFRKMNLS